MTKRIIDGNTYNTETATLLARVITSTGDFPEDLFDELYQNRYGAYFFHKYDYEPEVGGCYFDIQPLTPQEAQAWMERRHQTELLETHFGEMPEAGSGETRFTLRMPDSLKSRIDALAKQNKQSLNAWIIRCVERCAQADEPEGTL